MRLRAQAIRPGGTWRRVLIKGEMADQAAGIFRAWVRVGNGCFGIFSMLAPTQPKHEICSRLNESDPGS